MNRAAETLDWRGSALDVRLLGPIAAERDGESVSLGGPRQRAVLARLALVPGQIVTVDRLVDDVWGGEPPPTAVNTLQSYVSLLRRALGDPRYLRREGPGYVLGVGRHQLDASRFEDMVTAGRKELSDDPERALASVDGALAEWRGPALADVADEEWARPAAARWNDQRLAALEARFDALLALGRHADAVGELERANDEEPLREGFAGRLMIALYRSGRQADALRAYSRTRTILSEELGLDPAPELVELQRAILNHDPGLAAPAPPGAVRAPPPPGPATTTPTPVAPAPPDTAASGQPEVVEPVAPAPASPVPLPAAAVRAAASEFVGRQDQLETLWALWSQALDGRGHLALLTGEPGAGKSRLAAHFAAETHARGAIVLWGRATAEAIVPFEPMVEAVRTVLRTVSPEARRRVAAERGLLSLLLPELEQLVPESRFDRPDPSVERYLLFETVAELLRTESVEHPMLIVIDDLHWADAPSLKMVEHVLRHELPGRVMVVATARVPSDDPTPELDQLSSALARDRLLTRIDVGGLAIADVGALLKANGRDESGATELRAATGGNAFFVSELIRYTDGVVGPDLPESIRAMIGLRLDALDPVVAKVLNLTAIAGQAATLPVLVAASGLDGDELLDATDSAVSSGLLVETGGGRLGLPHALIGQAIRSRLGRTRLLDLHRRVAEAIEAASDPESSPALHAHHLLEAGSLVDRQSRVDGALLAARHSLAMGGHEDAEAWITRIEALMTDAVDTRSHAELALLCCESAWARGERDSAIEGAREAADWARRSGDPMLLARAAESWMVSLSGVGYDVGRPADPELIGLMEDAIAALPDDSKRHAVRLRSMLTSVLMTHRDTQRQQQLAREALEIAASDRSPELLASANLAHRLSLRGIDSLEERTEIVLAAVSDAHRAGNVQLELTAMLFAMSDLLEVGRVDEHFAMLDDFRRRARELHFPLFEVYALFIDAWHELSAGNYTNAQRLADEALEAGVKSHGINAEVAYSGLWYRLSYDTGRLGQKLLDSERLLAAHPRLRMLRVAHGQVLLAAGRLEEARAVLARFVEPDGVRLRDNQLFLAAAGNLAEMARALNDHERGRVLLRALEPYAGRIVVSGLAGISLGPVDGYVGLAALTGGELDSAELHLRSAIEVSARHGLVPYEARYRSALAEVLTRRSGPGDSEAAVAEAAAGARLADQIGLVLPRTA